MQLFSLSTPRPHGASPPCIAVVGRWNEQHLGIKAFFGTLENTVMAQIWIAIAIYVLDAIAKERLNLSRSLFIPRSGSSPTALRRLIARD
jgi:hypothetical protein